MNSPTIGFRVQRWPARIRTAVCLLVLAAASGCQYVVLFGYLLGGPPSIEPDYDKMTKKSLTDKGVTVAVVCFAPDEIRLNFTDVEKDIAKHVAHRLFEHKVNVVHPDRVQEWLDKHDDWDKPEEIGEATGATHVISIDVHKYTLFEENSSELYRGRADILISVTEMSKEGGGGEKIYSKDLTSIYPLSVPRARSEISYERFRRQYLGRLSEEIGRLFYEYYNGDDLGDVI